MAESFFATLECELLHKTRFRNQTDARTQIMSFIDWSRYAGDPPRGPGVLRRWVRWRSVHRLTGSRTALAASWSGSGIGLLMGIWSLVAARARWNTLLAQAYDLKVFFSIVEVDPVDVVAVDVLRFISVQRQPRVAGNVVRIEDGESGLSARTIKRRLATLAGLYDYLVVRGDVASSPVPKGLASRRGGQRAVRGVPLIRAPRMLPRVIDPSEVDAFHRSASQASGPGDGRRDAVGGVASL